MKRKIQSILNIIKPALEMHSGGVEFVDFDKKSGVVTLRLKGKCVGCPFSDFTVKDIIEDTLKHELPEVKKVKIVN